MIFLTKQGDTRKALKATLNPAQGSFDNAEIVKFRMANTLFKNVIDRHVDIKELPEVGVVFTPQEVAEPGTFYGEFVITFDDGKSDTYPTEGYITIKIEKNTGGA